MRHLVEFQELQDLKIVVEGDWRFFNQYGVMLVNPAKHPPVKQEAGLKFIERLTSLSGQRTIADIR